MLPQIQMLTLAQRYANNHSSCSKVKVGSVILNKLGGLVALGANRVMPDVCESIESCNINGHCVATIHSEIDAIIEAARPLNDHTILVTRYPCENCARAIVSAGIRLVFYGRAPEISDATKAIFKAGNVECVHIPEFNPEESR